jgi:ABC-type transport system substrate-binding protein
VFAEWKTGEYIRVVRNDDYWRGPEYPAIDEIVWTFIPDSNTRLNAMKARQYDYARLEPIHAEDCQDCETGEGKLDVLRRQVEFVGNLDEDQRSRLRDIATRCPVHRTLEGTIEIIDEG